MRWYVLAASFFLSAVWPMALAQPAPSRRISAAFTSTAGAAGYSFTHHPPVQRQKHRDQNKYERQDRKHKQIHGAEMSTGVTILAGSLALSGYALFARIRGRRAQATRA